MTDYVAPKLTNRVIPLTKDCDRSFTLRRKDPDTGNPVDWDADVYMLIDIDRTTPTRIDATVVGPVATVTIPAEIGNPCRTGTTWRVVMATPPSDETPLLVGTIERNDGR